MMVVSVCKVREYLIIVRIILGEEARGDPPAA